MDIVVEQLWKSMLQEAFRVSEMEERDLVAEKKDMEFCGYARLASCRGNGGGVCCLLGEAG